MILLWPTWHSTHFQEGGDNPKVEGQEFFPGSGKVKVAFPNEKYSTIMKNSQNVHSYHLILIPNLSNLECKTKPYFTFTLTFSFLKTK